MGHTCQGKLRELMKQEWRQGAAGFRRPSSHKDSTNQIQAIHYVSIPKTPLHTHTFDPIPNPRTKLKNHVNRPSYPPLTFLKSKCHKQSNTVINYHDYDHPYLYLLFSG